MSLEFCVIPSLPIVPNYGQFIFIERGYHRFFNDWLRNNHQKFGPVLYLPSFEREYFNDISDDEFHNEILPNIDYLYDFLDDARFGLFPYSKNVTYIDYAPFECDNRSINEVIEYGVLIYTGQDSIYGPIFAYASLVSNSDIELFAKLIQANYDFSSLATKPTRTNNASELPDFNSCEYLICNSFEGKEDTKYKHYSDYSKAEHNLARLDYEVMFKGKTATCQVIFKNINKRYVASGIVNREYQNITLSLSPKEFALYSFFVTKKKYMTKDEIKNDLNNEQTSTILSIWKYVCDKNTSCNINGKNFHEIIWAINKKIEEALSSPTFVKAEDKNRHEPFVISKGGINDKTYGIKFYELASSYRKYVSEYVRKINKSTDFTIDLSDTDHILQLTHCPELFSGSISVPDTVDTIKEYAFKDCLRINDVIIPGSVTLVESFAFDNCNQLKSIEFNRNDTALGPCFFTRCRNLEIIKVPKGSLGHYFQELKHSPNVRIKEKE